MANYTKGSEHSGWKGEKVSYFTLHQWVNREKGRPALCEHCGTTTAKKFEWASKSRKYVRDIGDWIRLCTSCHRKYDMTPEKKIKAMENLSWNLKNKLLFVCGNA